MDGTKGRLLALGAAALLCLGAPAAADADPPPPLVVAHPADGALIATSAVAFDGTTDPLATITIAEDDETLATPPVDPVTGAWSSLPIPVSDGPHSFTVTAHDLLGDTVVTVNVRVDTTAPDPPAISSPPDDSAQNTAAVTLSGTGEPGATIAVTDGGAPAGTATAAGDGTWTLALTGVAEATHVYAATATDAAGNVSGPSATRTVRVDLTPPPAPSVSGGPETFTLSSSEPGATFRCRLDAAADGGCVSPVSFPGLAAGDHTLHVVAVDEVGNVSAETADQFSVPSPPPQVTPEPQASPAPTPPPVLTEPPPVVPTFGATVVLRPTSGHTRVRLPGAATFQEIRRKTAVPLGTVVDVRAGVVTLTDAPAGGGRPESGRFYGGQFTVTQPGGATVLTLSAPLRCGRTRQLWGDVTGQFTIGGRFGTAGGRGSKWQVQDSCQTTTVRVARGVVDVRDRHRHARLLLRAGRRYQTRSKR